MENSFQTSFIPKKPIIDNGYVPGKQARTVSISMVVSVSILVIMIAATGGLYFYRDLLQKNKNQLSADLLKKRDSFDKDTISNLELYDKRSTVAGNLLKKHIVLSPLFEVLNELTLPSIQYTKFEHTIDKDQFVVKISGLASDYKSIALQADVFNTGRGTMLKDLIFSNLSKNKNNYVTFDLEFTVDPELLSYSKNITNAKVQKPLDNTNTQAPIQTVTPDNTQQQPVGLNNDTEQPLPVNNGVQQ